MMNKMIAFSVERRWLIIMVTFLVAVLGLYNSLKLPIDAVAIPLPRPEITPPVTTIYFVLLFSKLSLYSRFEAHNILNVRWSSVTLISFELKYFPSHLLHQVSVKLCWR